MLFIVIYVWMLRCFNDLSGFLANMVELVQVYDAPTAHSLTIFPHFMDAINALSLWRNDITRLVNNLDTVLLFTPQLINT
jgi:hypothetical protein